MKASETFYERTPPRTQCCICAREGLTPANRVEETRPTGRNFSDQVWAYCEGCFEQHQEIRRKTGGALRQFAGLGQMYPRPIHRRPALS